MLPTETFEGESCIQGYHTYSAVLVATVREQLQCVMERRNVKDPFAAAVLNGSDIVGHSQQDFTIVLALHQDYLHCNWVETVFR